MTLDDLAHAHTRLFVRGDPPELNEARAASLRKAADLLERFAKSVESDAAFKRSTIAGIQRALEAALEVTIQVQLGRADVGAHGERGVGDR